MSHGVVMRVSALILLIVGTVVVAVAVRSVLRRFSYCPSSIARGGEVWIATLARDAFRSPARMNETSELFKSAVDDGALRMVVDLSLVELGFYDQDVFGELVMLNHDLRTKGPGRLVIVKPSDAVYNSFEFKQYSLLYESMLVESVDEGVRVLEDWNESARPEQELAE